MGHFPNFVVFDCNVYVQAFLNPTGSAGKCFDLAREGGSILFVSEATIDEIRDVTSRQSIVSRLPGSSFEQVEAFVSEILFISQLVENVPAKFSFDRDPKDEIIIDLAIECNAEYLITWDKDLLDLMTGGDLESKQFRQKFRSLKIVTPRKFLDVVYSDEMPLKP